MKPTTTALFVATISAGIIILLIGFGPTLSGLYEVWTKYDQAYGHGLIIIATTLYLIYNSLPKLKSTPVTPCLAACVPLTLLSLSWYVSYAASITILQQLSLPLIILSAITVIAGVRITSILLFPILFLYFAIPVWDSLNNSLVELTIYTVQKMLNYSNIAAYIEGNTVQIAFGRITIADSCSGIRYLIVGSALSFLNAYMNAQRSRTRLLIIISGITLSLMANWIRVYSLIIIGYLSKMQSPLMSNHDYYGWLVFIITLAPIFIATRLIPTPTPAAIENNASTNKARAATEKVNTQSIIFACIVATLSIFSGPGLARLTPAFANTGFKLSFTPAPGWTSIDSIASDWKPTLPSPYQYIGKTLSKNNQSLNLHIYAYKKDNEQAKLLPYVSSIYDNNHWYTEQITSASASGKDGNIKLNKVLLKQKNSQSLHAMWYWYDIGGINSASYKVAKLSQILSSVTRKNYAFIVIIESSCSDNNCNNSEILINDFLASSPLTADALMDLPQKPTRQHY